MDMNCQILPLGHLKNDVDTVAIVKLRYSTDGVAVREIEWANR
jgi:hypothetical protein